MNREEEVLEIYSRNISTKEKIRLLEDMVLDLYNEEKAEQENMQPDLYDRFGEALRIATDMLRELKENPSRDR